MEREQGVKATPASTAQVYYNWVSDNLPRLREKVSILNMVATPTAAVNIAGFCKRYLLRCRFSLYLQQFAVLLTRIDVQWVIWLYWITDTLDKKLKKLEKACKALEWEVQ